MRRRRSLAVALLLLFGAVGAAAGCGVGAGPEVGAVTLTVTRDYGAEDVLAPRSVGVREADTVMRVLDRSAEISTRYGGGFVQSIEGIEGRRTDGRPYDWFFYVNGLWSPFGAADYPLRGGDAIWWDYRNWSAAIRASALVGSWPQPFRDGYEGERHPTAVECRGARSACAFVRRRLRAAGATLAAVGAEDAMRVLVGPWARLRSDPAAAAVEAGPQTSGVYAEFAPARVGGFELSGLDEDGNVAREFGPGAGLVAATRRYGAPPVWLVTGASAAGVHAAAALLDRGRLRDHYAVATEGGHDTALPLEAG